MTDRLPPLTALRAFEAAARHMSFAKAADELSVTPAALSFQIKNLEEHLGAPLFRRLNRAVELTAAGRALQPGTADGFTALGAAWRAARRLTDTGTLTITAGPAFTAKWLAPRLFGFAQAHRDIELRFSASLRIMDFDRDEVDIAIRFGAGDDAGLFSETIYHDWIAPMMRPDMAEAIRTPRDLLTATLIHDDSLVFRDSAPNWQRWFAAADLEAPEMRGPRFSQADHAIDMALEGGGVVLGRSSIGVTALKAGALVAPFKLALATHTAYRLVCPPGTETRPSIQRFREWIKTELAEDQKLREGFDLVYVD